MSSRSLSAGAPAISTREEFLQLERNRGVPADQLNLTPDRSTALAVNSGVEQENETRKQFVGARLKDASAELQRDHAISRLEGHARVDFDRSA